MPENELAEIMHKFTTGSIDILLATTIIESGLDIPNANTLIVDRADTFGLSQLHQIRGRVGRGRERAYAYFTYDPTRPFASTRTKLFTTASSSPFLMGAKVSPQLPMTTVVIPCCGSQVP